MEGRVVFTPGQLRELQHQALVLKYIMNGVNVPADLVNPIRSSIAGIPSSMAGFVNLAWGGGYRGGGYGGNPDPEPGRCRRTDGKKWRCSRDVVPDQKYCERHIHRGRHRSRKPATPAESAAVQPHEQTRPSPAMASLPSSAASSSPSTIALPANPAPPIGNHLYQRPHEPPHCQEQHHHEHHQFHSHHHHHHHHQQQQQQQLSPNLGIKPYSAANSPSASGLSAGSTVSASPYNQMHLHPSSKDVRYVGGIGADQMPFAETSGTSRGIGQDFQAINQQGGEVSMFSSMNSSWRRAPSPGHHPEPTKPSSHSMQYHSPQMRSLIGQDFNLMSTEMNPLSLHNMAQQSQQQHQHQYSFLGSGYGSVVEAVGSVGREHESQPLRHFFDDWPRSKDASALSWSNVDDGKSNPNAAATPHLSISTPVSTSDFNNAAGSPPGKSKVSSLKLSMWRAGEDEIPTGMELGVGVGLGMNEDRRQQHQANLIPITWETPVGGPLAEAFQSSTPRESSSKTSGLNLMTQGWEGSPQHGSPEMSSSPARDREGLNARQGSSPGSMEASKGAD